MKATELRIGNLIDYERTTHVVTSIQSDRGTSRWIDQPETEEDYEHSWEYCQPIVLNEEWMTNFGFYKEPHKIDVYNRERLRIWLGARGQVLTYWIEEDTTSAHFIKPLDYVHELQNLYYALTGQELTFKTNESCKTNS